MVTLERIFTLSDGARRTLTHSTTPIVEWATPFSVSRPRWHSTVLESLTEARELLDRLENTGRRIRELRILDDDLFEVRWRNPYSAVGTR